MVVIFILGILNAALKWYVARNDEWWVDRVEGGGVLRFEVLIQAFAWRGQRNSLNMSVLDSLFPGRDLNAEPPECAAGLLTIGRKVRFVVVIIIIIVIVVIGSRPLPPVMWNTHESKCMACLLYPCSAFQHLRMTVRLGVKNSLFRTDYFLLWFSHPVQRRPTEGIRNVP